MTVTVAIPVRNGGALLGEVLEAVRAQRLDEEVELLVCDSSSTDGSAETARAHGAEVVVIDPGDFGHGRTRNLLMERAAGERVAFLTQDATPASDTWLAELVAPLGGDVALSWGPYVARPGAPAPVARELRAWFAGFDEATVRGEPATPRRAYFTSANGAVLKQAWRAVPFRDLGYAEDQQLGVDALRAGFAKAYVPRAAVLHSHHYTPAQQLRRAFDEWRALREVYGIVEPLSLAGARARIAAPVAADRREGAGILVSVRHHGLRYAGAILGSRSERLPARARRALSLERRA